MNNFHSYVTNYNKTKSLPPLYREYSDSQTQAHHRASRIEQQTEGIESQAIRSNYRRFKTSTESQQQQLPAAAMFLPLSRNDAWEWPSFRTLDEDLRQLSSLLRIGPSARCDRNGVLTLTPNYRYDRVNDDIRVEVELPGVLKTGVSVEVQDSHLKVVAAKYSPDSRSSVCQCTGRKGKDKRGSKKDGEHSVAEVPQGEGAPPLPSVVYKLDIRLSSRADGDAVTAGYRGDGVLRICVPLKKKEPVRKVVVNVEG